MATGAASEEPDSASTISLLIATDVHLGCEPARRSVRPPTLYLSLVCPFIPTLAVCRRRVQLFLVWPSIPTLAIYSHPGRLPPTCPAVPGLAIYPHPGHLSPTWPSAPDQLPFPNVFALPVRPPGTTTREAKICFFAALISPFVWHCPERVNEDKRRRRVCRPPRIPNLTPSHKVTPHTAAIIMLTHATHHHCHLRPAIPTPPSRR